MKPIDELSLEEVKLVVSKLHERVQVPQFALRADQRCFQPVCGAHNPNLTICEVELWVVSDTSSPWVSGTEIPIGISRRTCTTAAADWILLQTAQQALKDVLYYFGLPADEVDVPPTRRFFDGPPIDITGGMDAADYVDKLYGEDIPEFKRGACGCGLCSWNSSWDWHIEGGCDGKGYGDYCEECGSLLGPGGWALLAGRDPKEVKWPEEATLPLAPPPPPTVWKGKDILRVQVDDPEEFRIRLGQMCGKSVLSVMLSVPLTETDGPRCELCGRKDLTVRHYSLPDMLHEYGHPYTGYACRECLGKQVVKALGIVVEGLGAPKEDGGSE